MYVEHLEAYKRARASRTTLLMLVNLFDRTTLLMQRMNRCPQVPRIIFTPCPSSYSAQIDHQAYTTAALVAASSVDEGMDWDTEYDTSLVSQRWCDTPELAGALKAAAAVPSISDSLASAQSTSPARKRKLFGADQRNNTSESFCIISLLTCCILQHIANALPMFCRSWQIRYQDFTRTSVGQPSKQQACTHVAFASSSSLITFSTSTDLSLSTTTSSASSLSFACSARPFSINNSCCLCSFVTSRLFPFLFNINTSCHRKERYNQLWRGTYMLILPTYCYFVTPACQVPQVQPLWQIVMPYLLEELSSTADYR
jgi:hypothetical protein